MLELRRLEPPLLPALADGALDVSNFDSKYGSTACSVPYLQGLKPSVGSGRWAVRY